MESADTHLDLLGLSVGSLLDLVLSLFGESNAEETQSVGIAGLHVHTSLDHRLPFLHHGSAQIWDKALHSTLKYQRL